MTQPREPGTSREHRVYVPATFGLLETIVREGGIGPAPFPAHSVTDELRAAWPDGDDEQWEYAALSAAAETSRNGLRPDDPPRRVVIAVDVDGTLPAGSDDPTAVVVAEVAPFRKIAAVHVDTEDLAGDLPVGEEPDLAWFATQEIAHLLP